MVSNKDVRALERRIELLEKEVRHLRRQITEMPSPISAKRLSFGEVLGSLAKKGMPIL